MSADDKRGKKRSKAFYRKSAHGGKRPRLGANVLGPGIRGFLIMCNHNESSAVKESYNILNEYADLLIGPEKSKDQQNLEGSEKLTEANQTKDNTNPDDDNEDEDDDDVEKALKKEVENLKNTTPQEKRFQNVLTKAKNCVFIRTMVPDPVKLVVMIMEDIASKGLKKARYAARILPILGTCKANTPDIESLAKQVLTPVFSSDSEKVPASFTILFKARNNNTSTCGKVSVIPAVTRVVREINPSVQFSWSKYDVAVLIEVVCTVCCIGLAPDFVRLRKYNLQELQQGAKEGSAVESVDHSKTETGMVCEGQSVGKDGPDKDKLDDDVTDGEKKVDEEVVADEVSATESVDTSDVKSAVNVETDCEAPVNKKKETEIEQDKGVEVEEITPAAN